VIVRNCAILRGLSPSKKGARMHPIVAGLLFATLDPNAASTASPQPTTAPITLNIAGAPAARSTSDFAGPSFGVRRFVVGNGLVARDGAITQRAAQNRTGGARPGTGSAATAPTPAEPAPAEAAPAEAAPAEAAPAEAAPAEAAPAEAAGPAGPEPAGPAGADGSAASDEPSPDLIQHRQQMVSLHRPLGIATFATLTVTEVLGLFAAINQRTLFGPGECRAGGSPIFGFEFGCNGLSALHGVFAFATVTLYGTTGIYALSMPDPERAAEGNSRGATRLRIHKVLAWVHAIGMVAMPVLGFLSANPNAFGIQDVRGDYAAGFRSAHEVLGFVTWGALGAAMITELVP
jgi:hypothetical protein